MQLTALGKELRKLRLDTGETSEQMAKRLGISQSYLWMIERGERNMPPDFPQKIAKAYQGARIDELLRAADTSVHWLKLDVLGLTGKQRRELCEIAERMRTGQEER